MAEIYGQPINFGRPNALKVSTNASSGAQLYVIGSASASSVTEDTLCKNSSVYISSSNVLRGATWNDFAETRFCNEKAGCCVCEVGDGKLTKTTKRLQPGCSIVSDTYGMLIGSEEEDYIPVAIAGRVLAFTDGKEFKAGQAVCSGQNGTVSPMNRLECILFPDRIIGYVSEIPDYKYWNGVEVEDRIWIKVK